MQVENTKHTYANVLSSCPEGPVDSGMIYLHSMASQWITDDLKKDNSIFSLPSVCLASGYRSTTTLLVSNVVLLREWSVCDWKTKVLAISPSIPSSVRFDGSRITPCKAIDLLIQEIEQDVKLQSRGTISKADTIFLWVEPNYFETLISLVFSESSDPQGRERVPWVYAKAPWTIEISNLKKK